MGWFSSIRTQFLLSYVLILASVVLLLNTYPIIVSRDQVFISKETVLKQHANEIGLSLGALETLNSANVRNVINMLDVDNLSHITVFNVDSDVLFQSFEGEYSNASHRDEGFVTAALAGKVKFVSIFDDGAFHSYASVPIVSNGAINGGVYIYEYDQSEGAVVLNLQQNLGTISLILTLIALVICTIFSGSFTQRITKVLDAIRNVRAGEYTYRVEVTGRNELSQLSEEFNSLTSRLQETEETRRRFVADASHELRTPLASIRLLSDTILQNSDIDRETVNEFVSDIRDESERLARTTTRLLELTKLDNNITTASSVVDCSIVAARVLRTLNPIAADNGTAIQATLTQGCTIFATDDELFQIIYNLTENAIKYSGTSNVYLNLLSNEKYVTIEVIDEGQGIPEKDMPYIFDRFYRVDKARARAAGGSGLGLSIVKSTAEKHGGYVTAENRPTGGMRFAVVFPLYSGPAK